jgi:hypothetical protein
VLKLGTLATNGRSATMMAVGKSSFCLVLLLAACVPALLVSAADPDPSTDFTVPGNGARTIISERVGRRIFVVARCS